MPSFWPWGRDQNTAESFERTLSTLSQKIQKSSAKYERLRQRSRRVKVSWTIYGGFTYIIVALIFILVTGWPNWRALEYSTIAGGPVLLWVVRRLLSLWYEYRIGVAQDQLSEYNKERDETIDKLKRATKYDSTQQLIDKYSNKPSSPRGSSEKPGSRKSEGPQPTNGGQRQPQPHRVFSQPPPTANIPHHALPPTANTSRPNTPQNLQLHAAPGRAAPTTPSEDFAPNAFDASPPPPPAAPIYGEPAWYDRILDALLGEDEMSAKNRIALICSNCRLVNGQAQPGARTLEDIGLWKCSSCGVMNGVERSKDVKEVDKILHSVKNRRIRDSHGVAAGEEFKPEDESDDTAGEEKKSTEKGLN